MSVNHTWRTGLSGTAQSCGTLYMESSQAISKISRNTLWRLTTYKPKTNQNVITKQTCFSDNYIITNIFDCRALPTATAKPKQLNGNCAIRQHV